ncbi:MAG: ABC transporter permease [Blastocatellia bacterium]|nr:ABC transporter permease [Blastocatellia bacterium]
MRDWDEEISQWLTRVRPGPAREAELVTELLQRLDERYDTLRRQGTAHAQAYRTTLAELNDGCLLTVTKKQGRLHLWLIALVGVIVPQRLRADWRQEWEAELRYRETMLADWDKLNLPNKLDLLRRSVGAFWDALWLQPQRWEDEMLQDLRYGCRMLLKNPSFTLIAVLTLALGIGANTAIFSLTNALLFRSLPVPQPEQLVTFNRGEGMSLGPVSYPDFVALRERNEVLSGLAASHFAELSFGNGSHSEVVRGELVSGDYFDVLRIQPVFGRGFLPEEERTLNTQPVVVISHGFWQSRFNSNPNIISQTITVNRQKYTVVGVAPAGFNGIREMFPTDFWLPLTMLTQVSPAYQTSLSNRHEQLFAAIGRLKSGVSVVQAQAALETINRQLDLADPPPTARQRRANEDRSLKLEQPQGLGIPSLQRRAKIAATLLFVVVSIVLLIACANVANLLLTRATARRKEIAVRLALGASRFRLVRQMLTESLLLGLLGAGAGLLLAFWVNRVLMTLKPPVPGAVGFNLDLRLDASVLGFTLLLALLVSLLFGLVPALAASKPEVVPALKDETGAGKQHGRFNLRNALVVSQLAVSLVLLIAAGLFIRSLQQMQKIDPGFQTENRMALSFYLEPQGYDEAKGREFAHQLTERVRALPGVQAATMANYLPMGFMLLTEEVAIDGRATPPDARNLNVAAQLIGLDYFRALGTPLVRGRDFTPQDSANAPAVTIINETMARRFFPNEDPIGKRLRFGDTASNAQPCEIVGVVKDTLIRLDDQRLRAVTYRPLAQQHSQRVTLLVHADGNPQALFAALRQAVQALDENIPAQDIKTLDEFIAFTFWPMQMGARLVGAFGLLGLLLASVGLYGVMSYAVAARTREIGVRMALGAERRDVLRLIVGQGLRLTLFGAGAGLALALVATRVLQRFLFGIGATDPLTFFGVALLLTFVALLACWLPARRATQVDPLVALRHQ